MPRNYQRRVGARLYKNYSEEKLKAAVEDVKKGLSLRQAAEKYGISRTAITAAVKNKTNKVGRPCVLSSEEEKRLVECVTMAGDWGFPLTSLDIRLIVKGYLDRSGRTELRFKNNMPGVDFIDSFLKRNSEELSKRLCQNIKRSRAAVNGDTVNSYFDELTETLKDVEPSMIVNYDETNITDDPGRKNVIVRRGTRHPERVIDFSKSSTSVMFAGSANGTLLPPYICYKATNLYDSWTENGPKGAVYNRSKSGWFALEIFEDWFSKIALLYFQKFDKEAQKVLIGDNLSSHISPHIIKECKNYNISFVLLPPNSTHYTQPLDVAFFRPLKIKWRETLTAWKEKHRGSIPKDRFPRLLKQCIELLGEDNVKQNLKSGFKAAGISPLNRNEVLKRLPNEGKNTSTTSSTSTVTHTTPDPDDSITKNLIDSFQSYLEENRKKETEPMRKNKKRKLNVPAGKGISGTDIDDEPQASTSTQQRNPKQVTSKRRTSRRKPSSDEENEDDEELQLYDSTDEELTSEPTDEEFENGARFMKTPFQIADFEPDMFVVAELTFNENTKKSVKRQFYATVLDKDVENKKVNLKFFRKCSKSKGNVYIFPPVDDEMYVDISEIITTVQPVCVTRGRHTFPYELSN